MVLTLPPHVCACIDQLEQAGFEAWAVGGCVRDLLRGAQPHDYDLTTSARPEETLRLFPHTVPTGITYGTVTVITQREPLEVTTFRTEEAYHDFRRPSGVLFASRLEEDLARRDFTVNAMAYAPSRGLADLFGGQYDLEARVIRAVGDPSARFKEDALRVLRAFRFASQLDFALEEHTLCAALLHGENLAKISAERVAAELMKSLAGQRPSALAPLLCSGALSFCGLSSTEHGVFPLLDTLPPGGALRLAALCRICGAQVHAVCAALKLSNAMNQSAGAYERQFAQPLPQSRAELKSRFPSLSPECWGDLLAARACLFGEDNASLRDLLQDILAKCEPWRTGQLAVNGNDLRALGVPAGRETGKALQMLLQAVLEHPDWNTRERLCTMASQWLGG